MFVPPKRAKGFSHHNTIQVKTKAIRDDHKDPYCSVEVKTADVLKGAQDASESAAGHSSQKPLQSK